jgi:hypothetical protein
MGNNASTEELQQEPQKSTLEEMARRKLFGQFELPPPVLRTLDWEKCADLHNKILDIGWAALGGSRKQRSWWDYYFGVLDPSKGKLKYR